MRAKIPTVKIVVINSDALTMKVTIPGTTSYKFKNLNQKINTAQWDKKAGLCKKGHKDCEAINRMIFDERTAIITEFEQDRDNGIVFTAQHIAHRLMGIYLDVVKDFYAFCDEQISIKNYSNESKRTYLTEVSKMKQHASHLSFADITYKWLQGYEHYMRSELLNHENTIWKSLKFLNTMLNAAIKVGGIIKENPMKDYDRGKYVQGIPVYIEWSEAQQFHDALKTKPITEYVKTIGYYCLLSYYGGLRFGDAVKFDYSKKVIEDTTGKRLLLYAQKNGEIVSIGFNRYINEVVEYVKDRPLKITNQEYNRAIKSLVSIAGITKVDISSHAFRHGFACRCAELGMSIDEVQKLLGHNKRSSTEIYFKIKNKRLDEAMKLWN